MHVAPCLHGLLSQAENAEEIFLSLRSVTLNSGQYQIWLHIYAVALGHLAQQVKNSQFMFWGMCCQTYIYIYSKLIDLIILFLYLVYFFLCTSTRHITMNLFILVDILSNVRTTQL